MKQKSICLNMIVKNENKVIKRCLDSVKGIIDYWVIVDTGSDDGTQSVIRETLKDLPGELHERPWVNFEHNRNEALDLARGKSDYLLIIDADEQLIIKSFNRMNLVQDAYLAEVISTVNFAKMLFIKNHPAFRWKGVLHEIFTKNGEMIKCTAFPGVAVDYRPIEGQKPKDAKKFSEDAEILEKALVKEPDNAPYVFFLAQTYFCLNKIDLAAELYKKRAAMGGPHTEQVFWSLYQLGNCQKKLNAPPELFLASFSLAYQYAPRAEPVYQMATHYFETKNLTAAYFLAKSALAIPKPVMGSSIEAWIYDCGCLLLFAQCAHAMGKKQEVQESCRHLLKKNLPKELDAFVRQLNEVR